MYAKCMPLFFLWALMKGGDLESDDVDTEVKTLGAGLII